MSSEATLTASLTGPGRALGAPASARVRAGGEARPAVTLAVVVAVLTSIVGLVTVVGADARWLAALGQIIVRRSGIPAGVPFAAAPSGHWANALVLAELAFGGLERVFGDRGLVIAQIVAVGAALSILTADGRAGGAGARALGGALALAAVGSLSSLGVARVQLFSLVLFPLLVALLRAEQRRPSRRLWLAPVLLALWSNLHGAALLGLGVLWAYLALSRFPRDRRTALGVGALAPLAMCLTPAGARTVDYYTGLLTNLAARRGVGMWAPLGFGALDLLIVLAGLMLGLRALRSRPARWELVVIGALALLTFKASRDGVWLLFMLVAPAAGRPTPPVRGVPAGAGARDPRERWALAGRGLLAFTAALAVLLLVLDVTRAPIQAGPSRVLLARAIALAHGSPILAEAIPAEELALSGASVWAGNPLDAFPQTVQAGVPRLAGGASGGRTLLANPRVRVVLAARGTPAASLTASAPGFVLAASGTSGLVYVRLRPGSQRAAQAHAGRARRGGW